MSQQQQQLHQHPPQQPAAPPLTLTFPLGDGSATEELCARASYLAAEVAKRVIEGVVKCNKRKVERREAVREGEAVLGRLGIALGDLYDATAMEEGTEEEKAAKREKLLVDVIGFHIEGAFERLRRSPLSDEPADEAADEAADERVAKKAKVSTVSTIPRVPTVSNGDGARTPTTEEEDGEDEEDEEGRDWDAQCWGDDWRAGPNR